VHTSDRCRFVRPTVYVEIEARRASWSRGC
jgi:hypothetical protein